MEVVQLYTDSPLRNFTYLIVDSKKRRVISIDPFYSEQVEEFLNQNNLELYSIFNTHEHRDHTCGNAGLVHLVQDKIYSHPNALTHIPEANKAASLGETFSFGDGWLKILDSPGHTMSHITILGGRDNTPEFILTGDTVFNAGVGNCKNGGDPDILYKTVHDQFYTLPDWVKLYPGHDYWETNLKFTLSIEKENQHANELLEEARSFIQKGEFFVSDLGIERKINLFFRLEKMKSHFPHLQGTPSEMEAKIFTSIRKLRDSW